MSYKKASDVLNYWFGGGDRTKRPRWFGGGEEATQEIRNKFGTLVSDSPLFVTQCYPRCHVTRQITGQFTSVYIVSAPVSLLAFLMGFIVFIIL